MNRSAAARSRVPALVPALAAALAAALSMLAAPGAAAQGVVYRCGAAYAQAPCAQGREIEVADPRSPDQVEQARRVAAADRRLADEMRRERLAEAVAPGGASNLGPVAAAQPVKPPAATARQRPKRASAKHPATVDFVALDTSRATTRRARR